MDTSDKELVLNLARHDEEAYRQIFNRHYQMMYQAALRLTRSPDLAKDACQEVFLELWKRRTGLRPTINLGGYLRTSVVNRALNKIKSSKIHRDHLDPVEVNISSDQNRPDQIAEANELDGVIKNIIDNLPNKCRQVFILSRYERLSYQQIADTLELSIRTVENHISKALKILRNGINEHQ